MYKIYHALQNYSYSISVSHNEIKLNAWSVTMTIYEVKIHPNPKTQQCALTLNHSLLHITRFSSSSSWGLAGGLFSKSNLSGELLIFL